MTIQAAQSALKKYFGYDAFRPMQADIIQAIFNQKDVLVLMPTGGGKSLCYQIPAITLPGVTVVVSPLISLMRDQVSALVANGIPAAFLNSSQSYAETQAIEDKLLAQELKLLYVSPEKLLSQGFLPVLKSLKLDLFAIDEAHCISAWGHDFRPEYTQMGFLKQQFPHVPIVALTATADKLTRKDIVEQLNLYQPEVFVASFDRPNLSIEVRPGLNRVAQIVSFVQKRPSQAGIVYCLSRKGTEALAEKLREAGVNARFYHANMPATERSAVQDAFINDRVQVVCATVAFGMGIDKSNVRWVIHYNLPKNIEGYYQEIGRAGRDGAPAETVLFYNLQDVTVYKAMLEEGEVANMPLQMVKLERMLQLANAQICRRKVLLNYFGENKPENCQNCDICKSPPSYFDGTTVAQMALSAVARLPQGVTMGVLVDILRGSARQDILEKGYHKIKTYGVGRSISAFEWQSYIWQLIQMGYLDIAYEEGNVLRRLPTSEAVLFQNQRVDLFKPLSAKEREAAQERYRKETAKKETPRLRTRNALFDVLSALRRELGREMGLPPYMVFSDATLGEMAALVPMSKGELKRVSGVGEAKMATFGDAFIKAIQDFVARHPDFLSSGAVFKDAQWATPPAKSKSRPEVDPKLPTHEVSFLLFKQGLDVDTIAQQRFIQPVTVVSHLVTMYEQEADIDIFQFLTKKELDMIIEVLKTVSEPFVLKPIYEALDKKMGYDKIKFAIAYYKKHILA